MNFVEYIQNGNAGGRSSDYLIDVGYVPTTSTSVEIGLSIEDWDGNVIFSNDKDMNAWWRFFAYQGTAYSFDFPYDSDARASVNVGNVKEYHQFKMWWDGSKNHLACIDLGTEAVGTTTRVPATITSSLKLWNWNSNLGMGTKIYYIKIWEGETLAMNLKPAENNGVIGLYDAVGGGFYSNSKSGTMVAGPTLSTILATYTGGTIDATGGTASINVVSESNWTASTSASFVTISPSTGDTGTTAMTATFTANDGDRRSALIEFVNATGDTAEVTISQKKVPSSAGTPVYLGVNEVTEIYLGSTAITEAYLGDVQVFSTGPFQGLRMSPKTLVFSDATLSASCKVKSSESWTMTTPAWITASVLTGDSGETIVILTATTQTAATSGTIEVTTTNYSVSSRCDYAVFQLLNYVETDGYCWFDTGIIPTTNTKVELVDLWPGVQSGEWPVYFGRAYTDWDETSYTFKSNNYGNAFDSRIGNVEYNSICSFVVDNNYHVVFDKTGININDTLYQWSSTPEITLIDNHTLWIAAENNNSTGGDWDRHRASIAKFGEIKIWENNILIADLKPAQFENSIGFYDVVSNVFRPNLGTGTPIGG